MADSHDHKYETATDDTFQQIVLESQVPVLVDFWAAWCAPCRVIAPVVAELADEYEGRAKVVKLDVDNNPRVAMEYGIRSIPTLLFFKDGRPVDQLIGVVAKRALTERLDALAGQPA
jgi:thioredoxin 1